MNKRISWLKDAIGEKNIYITDRADMLYYSGFSGEGAFVISNGNGYIITDGRYTEAAKRNSYGFEVICTTDHSAALAKLGGAFLFQPSSLNCAAYSNFINKGINLEASQMDFALLRSKKDESELNSLREAAALAENAYLELLREIKPGIREYELAARLDYIMRSKGAEKNSFDTICISGSNTSLPHGVPSDRKIRNGDFVTMDFGCVLDGYCSDMTRTVAVGSVTDEMAEVYNTVLNAQICAQSQAVEGAECKNVDLAARSVIDAAGYGKYFVHSTGHGVGIEIHEKPVLSPKASGSLENGNVVTIEPGIYIPGKFGVRIENTVIINGKKPESLQKSEKELIIL